MILKKSQEKQLDFQQVAEQGQPAATTGSISRPLRALNDLSRHVSHGFKPFCQFRQIGDRQLAAEIFAEIHRSLVLPHGQFRQNRLVLREKLLSCPAIGQQHNLAG